MIFASDLCPSPARRASAFTLVELLIALAIMAIALGVAVPSLRPNSRAQLISAAELIASDLEYAQSLSIASPNDFAMMRFQLADDAQPIYWIAYESDPDAPILKLYTNEPHHVTFGEGDASQLASVDVSLVDVEDRIVFDEFGRPYPPAQARVRLVNEGGSIDVVVSSSTGFITVEDTPS